MEQKSSISVRDWILYTLLVLATLAVLFFTMAQIFDLKWPSQGPSDAALREQALREDITELERRVTELGGSIERPTMVPPSEPVSAESEPTVPSPEPAAPSPLENRILVKMDEYEAFRADSEQNASKPKYGPNVYVTAFNIDKPNATVPYENAAYGLSVELPYNAYWGNNLFRVPPFEEDLTVSGDGDVPRVWFGEVNIAEGGGWARMMHLDFMPKRSAADAIQTIRETVPIELQATQPQAFRVGQLEVVRYAVDGLCVVPIIEVIGEKYNYVISPLCGDATKESFDALEKIARSIKLIQ